MCNLSERDEEQFVFHRDVFFYGLNGSILRALFKNEVMLLCKSLIFNKFSLRTKNKNHFKVNALKKSVRSVDGAML